MMSKIKKYFRRKMKEWCVRNFPLNTTTEVTKIYKIYVKKGKIREWRTYDENHVRIA